MRRHHLLIWKIYKVLYIRTYLFVNEKRNTMRAKCSNVLRFNLLDMAYEKFTKYVHIHIKCITYACIYHWQPSEMFINGSSGSFVVQSVKYGTSISKTSLMNMDNAQSIYIHIYIKCITYIYLFKVKYDKYIYHWEILRESNLLKYSIYVRLNLSRV